MSTKYQVEQRIIKDRMRWVVIDPKGQVVAIGSYISCTNACREFNKNLPAPLERDPPMGSRRLLYWRASKRTLRRLEGGK